MLGPGTFSGGNRSPFRVGTVPHHDCGDGLCDQRPRCVRNRRLDKGETGVTDPGDADFDIDRFVGSCELRPVIDLHSNNDIGVGRGHPEFVREPARARLVEQRQQCCVVDVALVIEIPPAQRNSLRAPGCCRTDGCPLYVFCSADMQNHRRQAPAVSTITTGRWFDSSRHVQITWTCKALQTIPVPGPSFPWLQNMSVARHFPAAVKRIPRARDRGDERRPAIRVSPGGSAHRLHPFDEDGVP